MREKLNGAPAARNSRVEWLRVLCMLMIVAYHYTILGFYEEELLQSPNKIFVDLFGMFGKTGTDLFVLISGYYMVEQRFQLRRLLDLLGTVWFYTVGAMLVFVLLGRVNLSRSAVLDALLPLHSTQYWFVNYYVLMMLFAPFLNVLLHALDRRQHALLCALCIMLVTVLPEFLHTYYAPGSLPLFLTLYVCAGYCRLHVRHEERTARRCLWLACILLGLCVLRAVLTDVVCRRIGDTKHLANAVAFMGAYSPFALALGVLLLIAAACRPAASGRWGARLGPLTFGVYLLHANGYVSGVLWQELLHTREQTASPWLPLHALGSVAAIYAAGLLVEALRQASVGKLWKKWTQRIAPPLERACRRVWDALFGLLKKLFCDA